MKFKLRNPVINWFYHKGNFQDEIEMWFWVFMIVLHVALFAGYGYFFWKWGP